jgi:hypothetical protein
VTLATEHTTPAPAQPAQAPVPPSHGWLRRAVPIVSLLVGVASALLMDRGPKRAALVAAAAVGLWLTLCVLQWLRRLRADDAGRLGRTLIGFARGLSLLATQSLVQLSLFFALPFYVRAAGADAGHLVFLAFVGALSAVSL